MGVIVSDTSTVVVNQGESIIQPGTFLLPILPSSYTTTAATDILVQTNAAGDSQYRYRLSANGKQEWGTGSASVDTNLYRSAANTLKTDGKIIVGGLEFASDNTTDAGSTSLRIRDIYLGGQIKWGSNNAIISNAGNPESSVAANPGSIVLDTTNGKLHYKNTGTGSVGWVDIDDALSAPPNIHGARVLRTSGQSVANGAIGTIAWTAGESWDTSTYFDSGTNTRITIPTGLSGRYLLTATMTFSQESGQDGSRAVGYKLNGGSEIWMNRAWSIVLAQQVPIVWMLDLSAGNYIEIVVSHNAGESLNLTGECSVLYLGP